MSNLKLILDDDLNIEIINGKYINRKAREHFHKDCFENIEMTIEFSLYDFEPIEQKPKKTKKKKYYAIKKGRKKNCIVDSWEECKKLTHKFSKASYKSFETREQAEQWLKSKRG